jgi:hypothetical protein
MLCVRRCWIVDGAIADGVRFESGGGRRSVRFSISFCADEARLTAVRYFLCMMGGSEDVEE